MKMDSMIRNTRMTQNHEINSRRIFSPVVRAGGADGLDFSFAFFRLAAGTIESPGLERSEQPVPADLAGMSKNRQIGCQALADMAGLPNAVGRINGHKDEPGRGDDVLARHKTPVAAVIRIAAIVAHDEIIVWRHDEFAIDHVLVEIRGPFGRESLEKAIASGRKILDGAAHGVGIAKDVRLVQALPVDVDNAFANVDSVAGNADDALDQVLRVSERRFEDDDLLTFRIAPQRNVQFGVRNAKSVAERADDHVVADEHGVFHGAAGNQAALRHGALDDEKREKEPDPRDNFTQKPLAHYFCAFDFCFVQ